MNPPRLPHLVTRQASCYRVVFSSTPHLQESVDGRNAMASSEGANFPGSLECDLVDLGTDLATRKSVIVCALGASSWLGPVRILSGHRLNRRLSLFVHAPDHNFHLDFALPSNPCQAAGNIALCASSCTSTPELPPIQVTEAFYERRSITSSSCSRNPGS